MTRYLIASLALAACSSPHPTEHYGFVARLGTDTVSLESVSRAGNTITSDEVDRFPRVRQRHTEITVGPDGGIQHLVMDITTPSEPENERRRHVVADVTHDSVLMTKRDGQSFQRWSFGRGNATVVAHVPQMYSLYELYFSAALGRHKPSTSDDTVPLRQFYIDREFDRFPLGHASVERLSGGKSRVWHDWLDGIGDATVDSVGRLLHYSGAHTTYKVDVERLAAPPNVLPVAVQFTAREAKEGGVKQLSVRDTARATIGGVTFTVDYGRPLARGPPTPRRRRSLWRRLAHRRQRRHTIHDLRADHPRRHQARPRHLHALDAPAAGRRATHRQRADGAVGDGIQPRARRRPRRAHVGYRARARRRIHDLYRPDERAARNADDGVGPVPLDRPDRRRALNTRRTGGGAFTSFPSTPVTPRVGVPTSASDLAPRATPPGRADAHARPADALSPPGRGGIPSRSAP